MADTFHEIDEINRLLATDYLSEKIDYYYPIEMFSGKCFGVISYNNGCILLTEDSRGFYWGHIRIDNPIRFLKQELITMLDEIVIKEKIKKILVEIQPEVLDNVVKILGKCFPEFAFKFENEDGNYIFEANYND